MRCLSVVLVRQVVARGVPLRGGVAAPLRGARCEAAAAGAAPRGGAAVGVAGRGQGAVRRALPGGAGPGLQPARPAQGRAARHRHPAGTVH